MNQEVEKVVDMLPTIRQLFGQDVYLTVLDSEGIICGFSIPEGQRPMREVGSKFEDPSGAYDEVIRTGKRKYNLLPKEAMGEAFEGYLVPIKDKNTVVGCLTCTYSVEEKARLGEIVEGFNDAAQQVNEKICQIIQGFESLYQMIDEVSNMTGKVEEDVNATERIVGVIGSNASKSNILALNASIEAARSGEHGRGFAVVAEEMGKLAKASGTSTTEIQKQLKKVHESIDAMISSINGTDAVAQTYNDQIKQIQEVVDRMLVMAADMESSFRINRE